MEHRPTSPAPAPSAPDPRQCGPGRSRRSTRAGRAGGITVLAIVLASVLASVLAGCGGGGAEDEPAGPAAPTTSSVVVSPATTPPGPGTAPATPAGSPTPPSDWSSDPVTVDREAVPSARLVSLRSAHNEERGTAYDRLVLEFTGALPGYTAGYVDEVIRPGSGAPLPLRGQVYFELVVKPAAAHDDEGRSTLTTPQTGGGLPALISYAVAGDYEGYVHIGLGLDDRVGFRVVELKDPNRLAIDFAA